MLGAWNEQGQASLRRFCWSAACLGMRTLTIFRSPAHRRFIRVQTLVLYGSNLSSIHDL